MRVGEVLGASVDEVFGVAFGLAVGESEGTSEGEPVSGPVGVGSMIAKSPALTPAATEPVTKRAMTARKYITHDGSHVQVTEYHHEMKPQDGRLSRWRYVR